MRKKLRIVAVALLCVFAFGACAREAKVIPARKMARIYREMLLADQWLADNPEKKTAADTTWFYEPIFEKYGYTLKDYQNSVDHYLNDPKRYAQMMAKVGEGLRTEDRAEGEIALPFGFSCQGKEEDTGEGVPVFCRTASGTCAF